MRKRLIRLWTISLRRRWPVVEHDDEPFSLLVDEVGEVLSLPAREAVPATLDARWRDVAQVFIGSTTGFSSYSGLLTLGLIAADA